MIALQIADIRVFMKKLLLSETFDRFLLLEGSVPILISITVTHAPSA